MYRALFCRYAGLFGGEFGLFDSLFLSRKYVGLFYGNIRLICGCIGLFVMDISGYLQKNPIYPAEYIGFFWRYIGLFLFLLWERICGFTGLFLRI